MPKGKNSVFTATSLDGYIADKKGGLEWLESIPNPGHLDMGYTKFTEKIDALVMGRKTYETVCGFGGPWPYTKPVFVWSHTLKDIRTDPGNKVFVVSGNPGDILRQVHQKGYQRLYIDGGKTIQSFLEHDLVDELIITVIPVLLGGGTPLFGTLSRSLDFELVSSRVWLDALVQNHYRRKKSG